MLAVAMAGAQLHLSILSLLPGGIRRPTITLRADLESLSI